MVDELADVPHVLAGLDGVEQLVVRLVRTRVAAASQTGDAPTIARGSEARILHLLGPHGARPSALVDGAWISKQAVGKRIKEMESRGLVTVDPDPDDGRAVMVRRTAAGQRAYEHTRRAIDEAERELAEIVGRDRYAVFRSVLDELASSAGAGPERASEPRGVRPGSPARATRR